VKPSPEDILQRVFDEAAGAFRVTGGVHHWKQLAITPDMVTPDGAGRGLQWGVQALLFDALATESVRVNLPVPNDMDLSVNPVLRIHLAPAEDRTAGSGFRVQVMAAYVAEGESYSTPKTDHSNVNQPVSDAMAVRTESAHELDASQMASGDDMVFTVKRDPTYAENRNGDMVVPLMVFEYVVNRLGRPYEEE